MDRVALLLNEVASVLHELPQRDHRVIIYVEPVVRRPGLHGNQNNTGVQLLLENLKISLTTKSLLNTFNVNKHFSLVLEVTFKEYLVEVILKPKYETSNSLVPTCC